MLDMSVETGSIKRDDIHQNDDITLTDVVEESEEKDKITRTEQDGLKSYKSETDERVKIENPASLKRIYSKKRR